ncbi:ADP-ribose glycohydrolase OARD1-like [Saccostrea echinata]|uniref:ADP-ribose glycohydrolase OARD1-like n=1 Tax=Saccostrea echinata TaxID=191078 RepID=UPI002A82D045|nr:ADP-ribose glycohydrolase OARD1-like [Saccostrea echinata]
MAEGGTNKMSFHLEEKKGDLFSCPSTFSLAHCISEDVRMGKGIAVLFKKKFGGVEEIKKQGVKPGGVAVLDRSGRYIYYLVTKVKYSDKPTYDSLRASLEAMKDHCLKHQVRHLAMPRIGCGLDLLKWEEVSLILVETFHDTDISITVYSL